MTSYMTCHLDHRLAGDQPIVQPLVVPFSVIVLDILGHGPPEVPLPERNEPVQALFFDRPYEPLGVGVGVSSRLHRQRAVRDKPFASPIPSIRSVAGRSS
jgi:hypothetical protein